MLGVFDKRRLCCEIKKEKMRTFCCRYCLRGFFYDAASVACSKRLCVDGEAAFNELNPLDVVWFGYEWEGVACVHDATKKAYVLLYGDASFFAVCGSKELECAGCGFAKIFFCVTRSGTANIWLNPNLEQVNRFVFGICFAVHYARARAHIL